MHARSMCMGGYEIWVWLEAMGVKEGGELERGYDGVKKNIGGFSEPGSERRTGLVMLKEMMVLWKQEGWV